MARNVPTSVNEVPLWSSGTTASYLDVPDRTLDEWAYRGTGPRFFKVGRHRRYDPRDVRAWLETRAHGGTDAA